MAIKHFNGRYFFLSNYYTVDVTYNGITYTSSETAFQLQKTLDIDERRRFARMTPPEARRYGRSIKLRSDWMDVRDRIMYEIVFSKFSKNEELKTKLLNTGNLELIEGNTWGDTYYGVCNGKGFNNLGKILMRVRKELRTKAELEVLTNEGKYNL